MLVDTCAVSSYRSCGTQECFCVVAAHGIIFGMGRVKYTRQPDINDEQCMKGLGSVRFSTSFWSLVSVFMFGDRFGYTRHERPTCMACQGPQTQSREGYIHPPLDRSSVMPFSAGLCRFSAETSVTSSSSTYERSCCEFLRLLPSQGIRSTYLDDGIPPIGVVPTFSWSGRPSCAQNLWNVLYNYPW